MTPDASHLVVALLLSEAQGVWHQQQVGGQGGGRLACLRVCIAGRGMVSLRRPSMGWQETQAKQSEEMAQGTG